MCLIKRTLDYRSRPREKNIAPLLVAGIAAGMAAVGAASSAANTASTNSANYKIWQEQKQFNWDMWRANNAYNTPAEQMRRYRDAGINPNLAIQQTSSGNSAAPADSGTPPTMQPADLSGISQSGASFANAYSQQEMTESNKALNQSNQHRNESEAALNEIEAQHRSAKLLAEINKLNKEGLLTEEDIRRLHLANEITDATKETQIEQAKENLENTKKQGKLLDANEKTMLAQTAFVNIQTEFKRTELRFLPAKLRSEIGVNLSQVAVNGAQQLLLGAQTGLVKEQIRTQVQKTLQEENITRVSDETIGSMADKIYYDAQRSYEEAQKTAAETNKIVGGQDQLGPIGGVARGLIGAGFGKSFEQKGSSYGYYQSNLKPKHNKR